MPSSIKVAIVAALERELKPLIARWSVAERQHAGRTFHFFENDNTVVICGGIGAEPARRAAEAVIALYAPQIIHSVGFAGALDPKLRIADILVPGQVIDAGDCSMVEIELNRIALEKGSQPHGILVTFGAVATPEQKVKLAKSFNAQAVDMEAAAVARAAAARGVRFAAVKVISDEVDFHLPGMDQQRLITPSGEFRAARFALFIMIRPWTWPAALRLARNSKRAALALCVWLDENLGALLNSGQGSSQERDSPKISAQP